MGDLIAITEIERGSIGLVSGWAGAGYAGFERQLAADLGVSLPEIGQFVESGGLCVAGFGQGRFLRDTRLANRNGSTAAAKAIIEKFGSNINATRCGCPSRTVSKFADTSPTLI